LQTPSSGVPNIGPQSTGPQLPPVQLDARFGQSAVVVQGFSHSPTWRIGSVTHDNGQPQSASLEQA
jgi:hypothetical protein